MRTENIPCPECGQVVTVMLNADTTAEEANALALECCSCPAGRRLRARHMQIEEAKENIEELCGNGAAKNGMQPIECERIMDILKEASELVSDGEIFNLAIKVSGGGTVTVSAGSKGQIKVKRSVGFTEQLEANQKL